MIKLKAKIIDLEVGKRMILLHEKDVQEIGILAHDWVKITFGKRKAVAFVDTTKSYLKQGEIGIFRDVYEEFKVKEGAKISVSSAKPPESIKFIHKKMNGKPLTKEEYHAIIQDVVNHRLGEVQIAAFLLAEEFHGSTMDEIEYLTRAMVETGTIIDFDRPCYDKHSIGGVPGNKVTLLIVPIVAAAGLLIPKTSSRAITSASGTADTMEVVADVEFDAAELKEIALKTSGAIVWGGKLGIAPADDLLIRIEHPLDIDPFGQMLASILSKKLSVGADHVVIDIPVGEGAKVTTVEGAKKFAKSFVELSERFNIHLQCGITYGGQPVGHMVGPALEAREALIALQGKGPASLAEKSTALAGILLEMGFVAQPGQGKDLAKGILASGKALEKMREIIEIQGGPPKIRPDDINIGQHTVALKAPCDGFVTNVSNAAITAIARAAGAPREKGAGVALRWKRGYKVKRNDVLFEVYAERASKLNDAYNLALSMNPVTIEGMLLHKIPEF
ncbi:MAG: AMP phosphorylase [Candidatus Bathyarchaeota archaeon]|nr:AMP phosphorylase [Candidatus Bathyarchaeota archaeon]MDH5495087.1 AMP phosphorylase [Candidatus Bathyarchaeota archaeon]